MDLEQKDWTAKQKEYDNLVVLDVRTPEEYAEKRLPQAQILDINDARSFMEGLEQLDKSVTTCALMELFQCRSYLMF